MSAAKSKYLKMSKKFESRIELTGSFRKLPTGKNIGNTSFNQVIEVLVKIRRKSPIRNYIRGMTTGKNKVSRFNPKDKGSWWKQTPLSRFSLPAAKLTRIGILRSLLQINYSMLRQAGWILLPFKLRKGIEVRR